MACTGDKSGAHRDLVGKPERKRHLETPGVEGSTVLKCIKKWDWETWIGMIWLRIGTGGGRL